MKPASNFCLVVLLLFIQPLLHAQSKTWHAGFDKQEYIEMLELTRFQADTQYNNQHLATSGRFTMLYRSPVMGLDNMWDLWQSTDGVAVISLRGTTTKAISWMENFYAAMVPAKGSMRISDHYQFDYNLASSPKAAVHVGWLLGMACLYPDIVVKIDSLHKAGIQQMIVLGHSQGGGLAYLLTAHLREQIKSGHLPADLSIKTYCSAAPKPGNLFFAYDYESNTPEGMAFNVVNAADWVPEVPFSIQTVNDFNSTNAFRNVKAVFKKQGFPKSLVLQYMYGRLSKPTKRAQRRFARMSGSFVYKQIKKVLPEYIQPNFYPSNDYVRTGHTIVMQPDAGYYQLFPDLSDQLFLHHLMPAYLYLAKRLP